MMMPTSILNMIVHIYKDELDRINRSRLDLLPSHGGLGKMRFHHHGGYGRGAAKTRE